MSEEHKTHLANSIEIADAKSKMDEYAKQILANKQVLSWIFKYTVEEIEDCIEGEPEVGVHSVQPGKKNREAIIGMNTESNIPNEGGMFFDVRCYAITKGNKRVKLILNVEAQKTYHLSYPWILRAWFYCARMVSEQKDTEFQHDNYGDLKKVYSIWLFMESPNYAAHTISKYKITHDNLYGEYDEKERYDLMNVIAVRLAIDKELEGGSDLHQMLETVFSSKMSIEEKEEKLQSKFGMRMKEKVKEGAKSMCNYSDFVEEQGILKGETKLGKLMSILLQEGLTDIAQLVAVDEVARTEYYKKYNIDSDVANVEKQ